MESVLQFGAGRFLRGFIDRFLSDLNHAGSAGESVAVVQSTAGGRADLINQHHSGFPVVVRGVDNGQVIEQEVLVDSISRALIAESQWADVIEIAQNPNLKLLVTNSTEAGYVLSQRPWQGPLSLQDAQPSSANAGDGPPETMPGKITAVLWARYLADQTPVIVLPCELISRNADKLCELVVAQAEQWELPDGFRHYAANECIWLNNLVDCMISELPENDPRRLANPLAIMAEPYALLAVEKPSHEVHHLLLTHPAVRLVDNLEPYYLRKVRVLNGIHTAMVAKYFGSPLTTVQQVMADHEGHRWVRDLLYGEILPTLLGRVDHAVEFADATLDRFRNPFMAHPLRDIRLNHEQKVPVRLIPTADHYYRLFGTVAPLLQAAIETDVM